MEVEGFAPEPEPEIEIVTENRIDSSETSYSPVREAGSKNITYLVIGCSTLITVTLCTSLIIYQCCKGDRLKNFPRIEY